MSKVVGYYISTQGGPLVLPMICEITFV